MSTSLIYHGFGIQGYHYVQTTYNDDQVIFSIKPHLFRCAAQFVAARI